MLGTQIGSYRITDKLGEGGMGVVYKAVDDSLDRTVAVKALSSELSHDPQLVERFRTEAKAQAHLNHTNIATLYSFLVHEGDCFMVMEFIEGESFDQMIRRRGPIPYQEAIPLFKQALLGIGFAHRMGIIHRDIKPGNMMVNRSGIVKVMDFGIAKVMGGRRLTRTGTQMGTVYYMSPEQIRGGTLDIRSDIYSLGVMLYEMLTAHLPFEGENDFQIMSDHVSTPPPPPSRFYPYLPKGVENAVLKALEKDPNTRFQSVEEFGVALEHPETFELGRQMPVAPGAVLTRTVMGAGSGAAVAPALSPVVASPTPVPVTPAFGTVAPASPGVVPTQASVASTQPALTSTQPAVAPGQTVVAPSAGFWTRGKLIAFGGGAFAVLAIVIAAVVSSQQSPTAGRAGGPAANAAANLPPGNTAAPSLTPPVDTASSTNTPKADEIGNEGKTPRSEEKVLGAAGSKSRVKSVPSGVSGPSVAASVPVRSKNTEQPLASLPGRRVEPEGSSPQEAEVNLLLQNAQTAYDAGKFIEPSDGSALYYARQARVLDRNRAEASNMENRVLQVMMNRVQAARGGHNYDEALNQSARLVALFPDRSELYSLKQEIASEQQQYARELERQRIEQQRLAREAQFARFPFRHRHMYTQQGEFIPTLEAWCVGVLTIEPEGTVRFDCVRTEDPYQGRCDHVVFPPGSIEGLKQGGNLHMSVRGQGNFDFFGDSGSIQGAYQAILPFASRKKR